MSEPAKPVEAKRPGSNLKWGIGLALLLVIAGGIAAAKFAVEFDYGAQRAEINKLLGSARFSLIDYFQDHGKWPDNLDKISSTTSGTFTKSVGITRGAGGAGEIEVTVTMRTEGVDGRIAGKTILLLSADGGKTWTCKPGTMLVENLPGGCQATK